MMDEIKGHLKDGQYDKVNELASAQGIPWKDTGFFSITKENIPGVGNNTEFLNTALSLNDTKKYSSELVRSGEKAFILKYKGAKLDPSTVGNTQMDFFKKIMAQQKMNMMIQSWTDSLRKNASVTISQDLVR